MEWRDNTRGPHPDSELLLSAIISAWLLRNAPYVTRLCSSHSPAFAPLAAGGQPQRAAAEREAARERERALAQQANRGGGAASPGQGLGASSAAALNAQALQDDALLREPGAFGPGGGARQRGAGGGGYSFGAFGGGWAEAAASSRAAPGAGAGAATAADAPDPPAPGNGAYFAPSLDLLGSVALLLTQQLCDRDFIEVLSCPDSREATRPRSAPLGQHSLLDYAGLGPGAAAAGGGGGLGTSGLGAGAGAAHASDDAFLSPEVARALRRAAQPGNVGAANGAGGRMLRPLPGLVVGPPVWARLQAPLFHFLRTHLARAPLARGGGGGAGAAGGSGAALECATLLDAWGMVLAPWRARPRLKNKLIEPDSCVLPATRERGGSTQRRSPLAHH